MTKNRNCSIFVVCKLSFHGSKLNSPSDFTIKAWWRFYSDVIPISTLNIFEMWCCLIVVDIDFVRENHQRIPHEQEANMLEEIIVNLNSDLFSILFCLLHFFRIYWEVWIIVCIQISRVIAYKITNAIISGFGYIIFAIFISFIFISTINRTCNNFPSCVHIS